MFALSINTTFVVFSKFFGDSDRENVLAAIERAERVLFIDTGATPVLVETISALCEQGVEVIVRDHHLGEGRSPESAQAIMDLLGQGATIVERSQAPACCQLVELGEFNQESTAIVADVDLDGLLAAMKAAGVSYEGLETDAAVLDGPRAAQTPESLTALALALTRALPTLPPFNPSRPDMAEQAKADLWKQFIAATQGDVEALEGLTRKGEVYEQQVQEAKVLATKAVEPTKGVWLVDTVGQPQFDLSTLTRDLESRQGCKVTVIRKGFGPIAGAHGVQYSLAVPRARQKELDLRSLVAEGTKTGIDAGLLSNTSFLLHCSEVVWEEMILPALQALD